MCFEKNAQMGQILSLHNDDLVCAHPMAATNTTTTNPLANVDWDDVLETLREQKCVLFLGTPILSNLLKTKYDHA